MSFIGIELVRRALDPGGPVDPTPRSEGRHAAVAAVLREGAGGAEVLLIRRAERAGDPWSGQMALPGGRHDPSDPTLLSTAVREAQEEVGLDLERDGRLITRLEDQPAMTRGGPAGLVVAPFVFELTGAGALKRNQEVEETLWVPLSPLVAGQWQTVMPHEMFGQALRLPAWDVSGRIVWGLTHRMLSTLIERLQQPPARR